MLAQFISIILSPFVWIPLVGLFSFLTYKNYKESNRLKHLNVDSVLLMLEIPRTNDKKELAAEQLFASLHGILRDKNELRASGGVQEHLSFESQVNTAIRHILENALSRHNGNQAAAARELELSPRMMSYHIKKAGLH